MPTEHDPCPELTPEAIALLRIPERHCPSCQQLLARRKRESLRVFAHRIYCNQTCYFDAVRAKKAVAGKPFAPGNVPARRR